jgi:hypothetical protein
VEKNYKLQNTNNKQITKYKIQITNKKTKGGHGLHKDSSRLQTMTAFNQKLFRGVQGGGFLEKSPPG